MTKPLTLCSNQKSSILVSDIQADYLEAKAKEDKADKRAFTMGIISSVTGILDFGLSSAISSLKPAESSELSDEEKANLKSEYEAKVKKLEAQITTLEESLQEPDLSEEDTTRLTGELDEKKEELKTLEDGGSSKWIASAASAVIGKISADTKDAQGQAQAAADKAADNATALQQKKYEVQKEQIELNANLKQLAEEIKNQTSEHTTLETAIKMLQLALKCLGNIVTALQSTAIFWRGIESGCKSIATDSLLTTIDALEPLDIETQQTIYLEDSFMGQMLNYMSTWVALNIISEEYGIASTAAGEKTRTNIKNPQFGADAYRTAQSMAEEILARML